MHKIATFILPLALLAAGAIAGAAGLVFGAPSSRIRGFYLIVSTLAAQFFLEWLFLKFPWFYNGNSSATIQLPAGLHVGGYSLETPHGRYFLVLATVAALSWAALNLVRGQTGRNWQAVRDMDTAAAVIGAVVSMAAAQFTEQDSLENFSMAIGFLCVAFVGIFALLAIPTAAAHVTGSFNLANFAPEALRVVGKTAILPARPVGWAAGRLGDAAKARGEAALSGALTGKSPGLAARARDREWAEKGAEWRRKMQGIEIMQGKRP